MARGDRELSRVDLTFETLELVAHILGRLIAPFRILLQTVLDDPAQMPGQVGPDLPYRGGGVFENAGGQLDP